MALHAASAALCFTLFSVPGWAGGWPPPADVTAWIGSASADAVKVAESGDLSGRGTSDWAGVVRPASFDVESDPYGGWRAVVFLQQPDGHYRLAAQSQPLSFDCGTSRCWMEDMHIARQSVFVEIKWSWHNQFSRSTYQFKSKAGSWPLIGVVHESSGDPDDGGSSWQESIGHNRATGQIVVTCQMGSKPPRVKRSELRVPKQDLADFGDLFSGWDYKVAGRCVHD